MFDTRFDFQTASYAASGTITLDGSASDPLFPGAYTILGIRGTANGAPIDGLSGFNNASNAMVLASQIRDVRYYTPDQRGLAFSSGGVQYNISQQQSGGVIVSSAQPNSPETLSFVSTFGTGDVCFVAGTLIETTRGPVAVEALMPGDIALTASGGRRPIVWTGHRTVEAQPMRISAGAFGAGLPWRDLYLSPGHPVLVGADEDNEGGALVPIMCLENGTSIARTISAPVTYWHVELDVHDVLLAEGLPAESYIDGGDRAFFAEASDHALHNPDFVPAGWNARCRPVAIDGPVVDAERRRLNAIFAASLDRHSAWPSGEFVL